MSKIVTVDVRCAVTVSIGCLSRLWQGSTQSFVRIFFRLPESKQAFSRITPPLMTKVLLPNAQMPVGKPKRNVTKDIHNQAYGEVCGSTSATPLMW